MEKQKVNLIYKELSYQVVGALFNVYNEIGDGHPEVVYQRAVAKELIDRRIEFEREALLNVAYKGDEIAAYYPDFIVDHKMILELKIKRRFAKRDFDQIKKYLKTCGYHLGILASFCTDRVIYRRVVNEY